MKVKVLGFMGGRLPGQELTGFLVDSELLIDAGSVSASLELSGQNQVKYLLLTHAHLDHLYGLAFLLENRFYAKVETPLQLFASKDAVEILRSNFLRAEIIGAVVANNLDKLVTLIEISPGNTYTIGKYSVEASLVNHYSGPLGYFVSDGKSEFLFTSDTGPTADVWVRVKQRPNCGLIITEVSFPNSLDEVARLSRHLTPALLNVELEKAAAQDRTVYLYHFKPGHLDLLFQELTEVDKYDLHLLKMGMELDLEEFLAKDRAPVRVRQELPSGRVPKFDYGKNLDEQRMNLDRDFGVSFEPGEIIFEEKEPGKHLYIVQEGSVEIYRSIMGKKKSLAILGPGDVFGEMSLITSQPRSASVRAVTKVRAYAFDKNAFEQLIRQNYGIALKIIRMLAQRLSEVDVQIENLLYPDNESKVINTLIRAVQDEGIQTKGGHMLRLTPEALALRTDLAMEEIKRILVKLLHTGALTFKEGLFSIPDLSELKKFLEYLELKQRYEIPNKYGL